MKKKVIVFDLDETIGHFEELGRFIDGLAALHENKSFKRSYSYNAFDHITQKHFNEILDLYPEFFRPNIFSLFKDILKLKKKNKKLQVMIYTNNMGPHSWTLYIKKYIENKLHHKLFDKVITGYRPGEKGNCRTTYNKTHKDLIKCGHLSEDTPILFFDDQYHPHMKHKNIQYVYLHPYKLGIRFLDMSLRFLKANNKGVFSHAFQFSNNLSKEDFIHAMNEVLGKLGRQHISYRVSKIQRSKKDFSETKRMIKSINKFVKNKNTRRKHKKYKNKTRKH